MKIVIDPFEVIIEYTETPRECGYRTVLERIVKEEDVPKGY